MNEASTEPTNLNHEDILSIVRDIISEIAEIEIEDIELNRNIFDDLGIDSLDALDIKFAIEKKFQIKIDEEDWQEMLSNLTPNLIATHLAEKLQDERAQSPTLASVCDIVCDIIAVALDKTVDQVDPSEPFAHGLDVKTPGVKRIRTKLRETYDLRFNKHEWQEVVESGTPKEIASKILAKYSKPA